MCRTKGHHKNECPLFSQYIGVHFPNSLASGVPWCDIFKTHGHDPYHFPLMQKYQTVPKSTFYNFCKSVGHEDKDCRTLVMMKERISDTYRVQVEHVTGKFAQQLSYNTAKQPQYNPCNNYSITLHNNCSTISRSSLQHNHNIMHNNSKGNNSIILHNSAQHYNITITHIFSIIKELNIIYHTEIIRETEEDLEEEVMEEEALEEVEDQ
jgi:hypothetical protein